MCYSVQTRDWIFVKGYGFLSFAKNRGKNSCKNISKNLNGKFSQKLLGYAKKSATDPLKTTSKIVIQKTAEAICDLIGNGIANSITKVLRSSLRNNWETVTNEHDRERIPKEIYISPKEIQKFTDNLRLIQ